MRLKFIYCLSLPIPTPPPTCNKSRAVYASSRGLPAPPRIAPPPKAAPKPVKPTCSLLAQSCLPQSGCCEPHTTCHCRFFNAICFCRKTILQYEKKS
uniref:Agouti domain-containing protein n=1 Tax=Cynoglossus semilaevis TaxID=244447 RepID=A0A3P8W5S2_CYNSE